MISDPPAHLSPKPDARCTRPPKSRSGPAYYFWRIQMWVEGTFVLHMLEPWEKILLRTSHDCSADISVSNFEFFFSAHLFRILRALNDRNRPVSSSPHGRHAEKECLLPLGGRERRGVDFTLGREGCGVVFSYGGTVRTDGRIIEPD